MNLSKKLAILKLNLLLKIDRLLHKAHLNTTEMVKELTSKLYFDQEILCAQCGNSVLFPIYHDSYFFCKKCFDE